MLLMLTKHNSYGILNGMGAILIQIAVYFGITYGWKEDALASVDGDIGGTTDNQNIEMIYLVTGFGSVPFFILWIFII